MALVQDWVHAVEFGSLVQVHLWQMQIYSACTRRRMGKAGLVMALALFAKLYEG